MYPLSYQYSMDIDWFYIDNGLPIHAASNGGHLKRELYTVEELQEVQRLVAQIQPTFDFVLNEADIINRMSRFYDDESVEELLENRESFITEGFDFPVASYPNVPRWFPFYCNSFIQMARRGFYSFDRDEETDEYFLVACPIDIEKKERYENLKEFFKSIDPVLVNFIDNIIRDDHVTCSSISREILKLIPGDEEYQPGSRSVYVDHNFALKVYNRLR